MTTENPSGEFPPGRLSAQTDILPCAKADATNRMSGLQALSNNASNDAKARFLANISHER